MKDDKLSMSATSQSHLPPPATGGIDGLSCMDNWRFGPALKAASKEGPAAAVLDLIMPEMNGFESLKRIRSILRTPVGFAQHTDER